MGDYLVRVRIEIVPKAAAAGGTPPAAVERVEEEMVEAVTAEQAVSLDDMEETLLETSYAAMRQALVQHFTRVSKKGLPSTSPPGR